MCLMYLIGTLADFSIGWVCLKAQDGFDPVIVLREGNSGGFAALLHDVHGI